MHMHINIYAEGKHKTLYLDLSGFIRVSNILAYRGLPEPLDRLPENNALTRYTQEGGATTNTQRGKVAEGGLTLMTILKGDCPVALCTLGPSMVHFCGQLPRPLSPLHAVMPHVGGSISIALTHIQT